MTCRIKKYSGVNLRVPFVVRTRSSASETVCEGADTIPPSSDPVVERPPNLGAFIPEFLPVTASGSPVLSNPDAHFNQDDPYPYLQNEWDAVETNDQVAQQFFANGEDGKVHAFKAHRQDDSGDDLDPDQTEDADDDTYFDRKFHGRGNPKMYGPPKLPRTSWKQWRLMAVVGVFLAIAIGSFHFPYQWTMERKWAYASHKLAHYEFVAEDRNSLLASYWNEADYHDDGSYFATEYSDVVAHNDELVAEIDELETEVLRLNAWIVVCIKQIEELDKSSADDKEQIALLTSSLDATKVQRDEVGEMLDVAREQVALLVEQDVERESLADLMRSFMSTAPVVVASSETQEAVPAVGERHLMVMQGVDEGPVELGPVDVAQETSEVSEAVVHDPASDQIVAEVRKPGLVAMVMSVLERSWVAQETNEVSKGAAEKIALVVAEIPVTTGRLGVTEERSDTMETSISTREFRGKARGSYVQRMVAERERALYARLKKN